MADLYLEQNNIGCDSKTVTSVNSPGEPALKGKRNKKLVKDKNKKLRTEKHVSLRRCATEI